MTTNARGALTALIEEGKSFLRKNPRLNDAVMRAILTARALRRINGVHSRECSVCGHVGRFSAFGDPPRWDARCPKCLSLERHRLLALLLQRQPLVGGRIIQFAPDICVTRLIEPLAETYQTADLYRAGCDLTLNLEAIDLPDRSVDVFVVSHLLEHVDDRKALGELYRCLRPGGQVIIMVPIIEGWTETYENPAVNTARERVLHFGQHDHVRYYGADLRDRVTGAGFALTEFVATGEECATFGLWRGERVFIASRGSTE